MAVTVRYRRLPEAHVVSHGRSTWHEVDCESMQLINAFDRIAMVLDRIAIVLEHVAVVLEHVAIVLEHIFTALPHCITLHSNFQAKGC